MSRKTIVIDREYGSGGREVAIILARKLGMDFYDGNLLAMASEQYHIDIGMMKNFDEKRVGGTLFNLSMAGNTLGNMDKHEAPFKAYDALARLMRQLVREKPCIFMGRCADEVLKGVVPLIHVYIYADNMQDRIQRVEQVDGLLRKEAEAYISKKDLERKKYYNFFTGKTWGEMKNYDLCLNTSTLGYEEAAEAIIALAK